MIGRFTNEKENRRRTCNTDACHERGKTVEYIRSQMKLAMISGLCNPDPQVQANWKKIPCKGEAPTPEELTTYLATYTEAGIDPFV